MAVKTGRFSSIAAALTTTLPAGSVRVSPETVAVLLAGTLRKHLQCTDRHRRSAPLRYAGPFTHSFPTQWRLRRATPQALCSSGERTARQHEHRTAVIYYFALAGPIDGTVSLGQRQAGDRKILWLRF